jgi:hypothetical protein
VYATFTDSSSAKQVLQNVKVLAYFGFKILQPCFTVLIKNAILFCYACSWAFPGCQIAELVKSGSRDFQKIDSFPGSASYKQL